MMFCRYAFWRVGYEAMTPYDVLVVLGCVSSSFRLQASHQSKLQSLREKFQEEKDALNRHHRNALEAQKKEVSRDSSPSLISVPSSSLSCLV